MFERYTEKARRVIFFARYEASQFGSPYIETEHLLLGLLREDKALTNRFLRSHASVESIRKQIEGHTTIREKVSTSVDLPLSNECKRVLAYAAEEAERLSHKHIGTEHLLLGLLREEKCFAAEILMERGLRLPTIREELQRTTQEKPAQQQGGSKQGRAQQQGGGGEQSMLAEFSRDLTQAAMDQQLDPLVGRDTEVDRVIQILCRRTKNNPVLIGEPGVGKTAIVEGLAQKIADGEVPSFLADKRVLSLDLSLIVAGTKYRGQFEERLKTIMKELMENQNSIVFIDELHTLVGAGSAEGSLDAANILKPALSRGEIQCIGATTPAEFRKSIEKDRSLERRFQAVKVPPPNEEDAIKIIMGIKDKYEKFHAVSYTDEAITFSVTHSSRYIPDRFLPDKAIDLIDEAGARVKLRQTTLPEELTEVQKRIKFIVHRMENAIANHEFEKARFYSDEERKERENLRALRDKYHLDDSSSGIVTKEDIEDVVSRWTGVPINSLKEEEMSKLMRVEEELHKRVISQEKAISALSRAIRRSRAGLKNPARPIGSFLFLGPTGVGKTEMARTLAQFLFGSDKSLIRFDMSEFMEKHSISKLIGSPPGYVGYEEGGQLTERVKRSPYSVVLLDEIEKAHPDVFNLLLQVFEDGHLTDGLGNTVDFKNTILIMTSNIGAKHLMKREGLGFASNKEEIVLEKMEEMVKQEVKRTFNPEFINRLDEIIVFTSLSDADLMQILELLVQNLNTNLVHKAITISVNDEAKKWILDKTLVDRSYGARPLRRALQRYVEDPLSEALIAGQITARPAFLEVYLSGDKLFYRPVAQEGDEQMEGAALAIV
ncbi:ATPase with chaperone activity, ATP-binding subunit [Terriglobus roseus DSM 18391]|uniref:ATPase with chaperone activity, ATP-binding subunit n=1 Tax=Terriglobus roseus (strain DSM 18391 / NRRL B-41598 / KBS 63) TaxID=926566 RepID=I3ZEX7_TERRK|nr:ATP-dependent Clp protease ATP-binding subunit [Terriglobus roseus]AFL87795.1 ATPase with chaperone activity, ATP-binding subunit [Terriglobus roseus DSM 18391]